ncbi:dihydrofolate reductase family protein, partial [Streptomyces olivaceoviridis]
MPKGLKVCGGRARTAAGATLVRALIAAELVDELRLVVMPVLLGGGKSVF